MRLFGSGTHFTPKGSEHMCGSGGYQHATTTWLTQTLLVCVSFLS